MTGEYLNYSGWMTAAPPPFFAKQAEFLSLVLHADPAALQTFLDRTYNVVAGRPGRYRPLVPWVFALVLKAGKIKPTQPPFCDEGWAGETDAGLWLPVGDHDAEGGLVSAALVPAYLFIDNAYATTLGREIWGFPKFTAKLAVPDSLASGEPLAVSGVAIDTFAPAAIAREHHFLTLRGAGLQRRPAPRRWQDVASLLGGRDPGRGLDALAGPPAPDAAQGWNCNIPFATLFLKQFRSAGPSPGCVYQSLVQGALTLNALHAANMLLGDWTLAMNALDSMPFIRELGLGAPDDGALTLTASVAFWASIDFTVEFGAPVA